MSAEKKREFYIASIEDSNKETTPSNNENVIEEKPERFKSPDVFISPIMGPQKNKLAPAEESSVSGRKRYEGLSGKRMPSPTEMKRKYGEDYEEYGVFDNDKYREILETGTLKDRPKTSKRPEWVETEELVDNTDEMIAPQEMINVCKKPTVPSNVIFYEETTSDDFAEESKIVVEEPEKIVYEKPQVSPKVEEPKKQVPKHRRRSRYQFPPYNLLKKEAIKTDQSYEWAKQQAEIINQTFVEFGYGAEVASWIEGPSVTQFLVSIKPGTNVHKIRGLEKDLLLKLSATSIRLQDPIPGKNYAGIEIPNLKRSFVPLGNLLDNPKFTKAEQPLLVALGLDINGSEVYVDIAKMPHGLIAGTTGSGKSICIHSMITSLLYRNAPERLRLILIDPKMVELSCYDDIPHLALPVITDPKKASAALRWVAEEMDKRFTVFKISHTRDIQSYNEVMEERGEPPMPLIVIVIDELADLMSVAASEVEGNIQRITAKARAAGIHLIVATQRPSTDIIRGSIKNNIPIRVAFRVASFTDSNTIIDHGGAEKLLANGDMLYVDTTGERRLQGAFLSYGELTKITNFLRDQDMVDYLIDETELEEKGTSYDSGGVDEDEKFDEIARYVVQMEVASVNRLMQVFNISFNRANRIFAKLEQLGVVSSTVKGKQREVLVGESELEEILLNR